MPMRAAEHWGGLTDSDPTISYAGKWITGDYDLLDIMSTADDCERPNQDSAAFAQIKKELNSAMSWHGIQHGPQVQWKPRKAKGEPADDDFTARLGQWLNSPLPEPPLFDVGIRKFRASDDNITVVFPGGAVHLAEHKDVKDALLCKGCANPTEEKTSEYD